ncbi:MAG: NAD(P)-dependent oxidoreductase [Deltaproteobacteria bacterium]
MSNPKVLIYAPADEAGEVYSIMEKAGCKLFYGKTSWHTPRDDNESDICATAKGADALIGRSLRSSRINAKIMESAPNLRIIAKSTIGVDDVDVEAATDQGILVTNSPVESNWGGVAEGAIAIILTLIKRTRERDEAVKQGKWRDPTLNGLYLGSRQDGYPGLTIGLVGLGRIARRVAELLAPWKPRIIGYDPYLDRSQFAKAGVEPVDLTTLLKESDIISLHAILTKETRRMIGTKEFALMKPSAILINTARGQMVDEKALVEALQAGKLAAAGLDAFEQEPLPADSPLLRFGHRVLLSPHMASATHGESRRAGMEGAIRSVLTALNGEVPDHVYNREAIPRWVDRFGGRKV